MSGSPERPAYDPNPTRLEREGWSDKLEGTRGLRPDDFANAVAAQLLVEGQVITLARLQKSEGEVEALRGTLDELRGAKENLRVDLARARSKNGAIFAEIPIGFLGGIGINLLTSSAQNAGLGWLLLGIACVVLLILRASDIADVLGMHAQRRKARRAER